jgi:hypothetical protein
MITFVITAFMRCDAVFPVNFPLHFRRNVTHLFGVSGYTEILNRDIEHAAGGQIRIGKNWCGLLGEDHRGQQQQEAKARMNVGEFFTPAPLPELPKKSLRFLAPATRDVGGGTNRANAENEPEPLPRISFCLPSEPLELGRPPPQTPATYCTPEQAETQRDFRQVH